MDSLALKAANGVAVRVLLLPATSVALRYAVSPQNLAAMQANMKHALEKFQTLRNGLSTGHRLSIATAEAERMLPDAVEALTAVDHSARGEMLGRIDEYRQLLDDIRGASKRDDTRVGATVQLAIELARQQTADAAKSTLTAALNEATNLIDQATLHGELGNRLAKTEPQAAQTHYEQSQTLYEAAGHSGMARYARWAAEKMRVDHGVDPAALLALADECPVTTVKLNALITYGGVLLRQYENTETYSDAAVDVIIQRIEQALNLFDTEPETLGQTALQLTSVYMMKEDFPAARRTLERARVWLVRANSTYLNNLEQADRQLRDEGV